uniref:KIB1-4 beta-propeller domain-containing protein n=1 Tax=Leersia perrieri TaxID=77586 RepID=A0A0D9XDC1_9ORYZ
MGSKAIESVSNLAPLLLFNRHHDNGTSPSGKANDADEATSSSLFLYSIPKGQPLTCTSAVAAVLGDAHHRYWVTPQGWLLVLNRGSRNTFLFNPLTLQMINLPRDDNGSLLHLSSTEEISSKCLLSQTPTDPACVVLLVDLTDTVFHYCYTSGTQWVEHVYRTQIQTDRSNSEVAGLMGSLTAIGGNNNRFHAYLFDDSVTLDFSPDHHHHHPTLTLAPLDIFPWPPGHGTLDHVFVELRGEWLCLSFCHPLFTQKVAKVVVHRVDVEKGAWVKVDALGDDAVIFASVARRLGLEGNRVYFVASDDKALYLHDMERGSTVMHDPAPHVEDDLVPEFLMAPI